MGFIVLFQLTFNFIYITFKKLEFQFQLNKLFEWYNFFLKALNFNYNLKIVFYFKDP